MSGQTKIFHVASDLKGRGRFMPAYEVMLQMCGQLIAEAIGDEGDILVLGAGGGLELETFARRERHWRFCAIDPDRGMLDVARGRMREAGWFDRVSWIDGYVFDAPASQYGAATCLLTLHFAPDDGAKLETLRALRARLKPGAPFMLVDLCMDKAAPDHLLRVERYRRFALNAGAAPDEVAATVERVRHVINTVSAERNEALLAEAGFAGADLFYAGHSWRGWVAYA